LVEDAVHFLPADVVQPLRTGRGRSETNSLKTNVLRKMAVNTAHITDAGRERHAGSDRICAVAFQQLLNFRDEDVVAPLAIVKDALAIVEFLVAVHTHGHPDAVFREKIDDLFRQERAVGRQTELDFFPFLLAPFVWCIPRSSA